jgi:beta-lactam-binding protein with PASTA domain
MLVDGRKRTADAEPGHVLSQSVAAGASRQRGEAVSVVLAAPLAIVPALTGLSVDRARQAVTKAGYRLEVGPPIGAPEVRAGRVARQTPEVEAPLEPNGVVTVRVAQRAPAVDRTQGTGLKTPWEAPNAGLAR